MDILDHLHVSIYAQDRFHYKITHMMTGISRCSDSYVEKNRLELPPSGWSSSAWWLVYPAEKYGPSIGMIIYSQYFPIIIWENRKWQPNHQAVYYSHSLSLSLFSLCLAEHQMENQ